MNLPCLDEGNIDGTSTTARAQVEGTGGPQQCDSVSCVVRVQRNIRHEGLNLGENGATDEVN